MPATKLATTASVSTTTELALTPKLRKRLLAGLQNYQTIAAQIKELKAMQAMEVAEVEAVREILGQDKFAYEGFKVARVTGFTAGGQKQNLIDAGIISLSQWEDATENKPKKVYTKISCGGSDDEG